MKTIVLGASNNPTRYAYKAVQSLLNHKHEVIPVSNKKEEVLGLAINNIDTIPSDVDTVTLYVGPQNQSHYIDYILKVNPRRVIFNPGTENDELVEILNEKDIECIEACTLVMLATNQY
jgi:predicted CoA-binding protein